MKQFPKLSKVRRVIVGAIFVFGFIIGAFILFPNQTKDVVSKLFFGLVTGIALVYLTTPELMKLLIDNIFQRNLSQTQKDRLKNAKRLRLLRSITHPTTIPLLLAIGLWILTTLILIIFKIELKESMFLVFMFVTAFLIGSSGILMIVRREAIGENGDLIRGVRAIFYGIVWLIISLGFIYAALKISTFQ